MTLDRVSKGLFAAALLLAGAALVATLAWTFTTLALRPLDGVEGDVLFEADRLRARLPLFVSLESGATEYGPPPSRFLVLYPPLWSAVLSVFPKAHALVLGRIVATGAWFGVIAAIAFRQRQRRPVVLFAAAFVASAWVLALFGGSARPDALAVACAGFGLDRISRRATPRATVDIFGAVLLALAAWIKPNVVGILPGVFVAAVLIAPRTAWRRAGPALAAVVAVVATVAGVLTLVSGRAWVEHLLRSTGQPPNAALFVGQIASRGPFFLLPLAAAVALGVRDRRSPAVFLATGGLVTSALWSIACLAKIGSATNYFMEPLLAALVVVARAEVPALASAKVRALAAAVSLTQMAWTGIASVRSATEHMGQARVRAAAVEDARERCRDGVILADEPGLEMMLDGRLVQTPFQSTHLARRGAFPLDLWMADVVRPEVKCLVMQDDLLERDLADVRIAHDRFGPELRRVLVAHFAFVSEAGGIRLYRRKGGVSFLPGSTRNDAR